MKYTKEQIADMLVQATSEYTEFYFKAFGKNKLDKQLWAALHIGFIVAMKANDYSSEELDSALELAHDRISALIE